MRNRNFVGVLLCLLIAIDVNAQKWVDTVYGIQEIKDVKFGEAVDFGGTLRSLEMNICIPQGDSVPPCGRPLLVVIHGGAFLAGDKDLDAPPVIMKDFAKRGYLTASINYRLGFFQTSSQINCNISSAGAPWNCLNASDSGEWERALYRGMQDAKGAIRYLINRSSLYRIDARNVFLVGESAGGFVALSAAFMDDSVEKPLSCSQLASVARPNKIYENQCIVSPGFSSSVDSLQLLRPDLGLVSGPLNISSPPYLVKGVGNIFGGMYADLFSAYKYQNTPVLYMFHQPNDLIVPYRRDKLFAAYAYCATQFPANCQYIINRKTVMGSAAIRDLVVQLAANGKKVPKVLFDSTLNNADCFAQFANPALAGHAIDNLPLRSLRMAGFFAKAIDTGVNCQVSNIHYPQDAHNNIRLFPNPAKHYLQFEAGFEVLGIEIKDMTSKSLLLFSPQSPGGFLDINVLKSGIYFLEITGSDQVIYKKIIVD